MLQNVIFEKKEEIWISPMTKALTPIEKSTKQRDHKQPWLHNDCGPTKKGQ